MKTGGALEMRTNVLKRRFLRIVGIADTRTHRRQRCGETFSGRGMKAVVKRFDFSGRQVRIGVSQVTHDARPMLCRLDS